MTTPKLNLPEIVESQAGKAITHNEALAMLDVFVNGTLLSRTTATPPGSPTAGDAYFVPGGATGDWAAHIGKVAHWYNNQWYFYPTPVQWLCYFLDETENYRFNGTDWDLVPNGVDITQYGLGSNAKFITVTDYNDLDQLQTGFYATFHSDTSTVANKPAFKQATNVNALIKVFKESDRFSVEVVETKRTDSRHFREKTGVSTWGSWRDLWAEIAAAAGSGGGGSLTAAEIKTLYESNPDTNVFTDAEEAAIANLGSAASKDTGTSPGDVMTVSVNGVQVSDFNNMPDAFLPVWAQSGATNAPISGSINWTALRVAGSNQNNGMELFGANGADRYFARTESGSVYSQYVEFFTTGNSVNPLDLGFGTTAPSIPDLNDAPQGSLRRFSSGTLNRPPQMTDGVVFTMSRNSARRQQFSMENTIIVFRSETSTNVWTDWKEIITEYNQNGKAYADMTAGNVTLGALESNVPVIQLGGTPGTSRTLTVAALERMWVVTNDSDGGCTLTTGSGGTVFLEAGYQYIVFGDGVGVRAAITIAPNGLKMNGDLILPIYSTASLPDPSTRYMVTVGCTDGDSGAPCLAVSDGGSWKRVSLGATVSAT